MKGGKGGGILQLSVRTAYIDGFDTFTATGRGGVPVYSPFLNNLLWTDPYGDGKAVVGDAAEAWTFAEGGKVITFRLRPGIQFHDGKPLTSADVAYNIERGWKPRSATMTQFKDKLDPLERIETPDDFTVRLTLSRPSNSVLSALSISQFLIYPAHVPFPESGEQWKKTGVGSGPFKLRGVVGGIKVEAIRNEKYWKLGLPYLDGLAMNAINDDTLVASGFRTGKLDATTLDGVSIRGLIRDGILQKEQGFVPYTNFGGGSAIQFVQRDPWTDPRAREAVDLAINRQDFVTLALEGWGNPHAPPLLPPELGGQWGIPIAEMKIRPGYREDKSQDLARARQLLAEAGIDPGKVQLRILESAARPKQAEVIDSSLRSLGFRPEIVLGESAQVVQVKQAGTFEITSEGINIQVDDPIDFLGPVVKTGGTLNPGKWSDPEVDRLLEEQDRTLDVAKRTQMLRDLQERIMKDRHTVMLVYKSQPGGGNGYVKNYPPKVPFLFDSRFRWEQVWLER